MLTTHNHQMLGAITAAAITGIITIAGATTLNADATSISQAASASQTAARIAPPTTRPPPITVKPTTTTTNTTTTVSVDPRAGCDPSYPTVCIPPRPPDLNCPDIPFRDFVVLQPDPHGFDRNKDGIGCES